MKRTNLIFLALVFTMLLAPLPQALAAEGTAGDYFRGIGKKFGRGFVNVVTSPAEIPCTTKNEMAEHPPTVGFFTGVGRGFVFMLRRSLVGATEMATFIIPMEATIPAVCTEGSAEALS
jgi:putative exosortase-associated protein (TIGR04073 family)